MKKGVFTGVSIIYFLAISVIAMILTTRLGLIFSNPQIFVDEALSSVSSKLVLVCNGFSTEEVLPPPPAGASYVCGTKGEIDVKKAVEGFNFVRGMIGLGISVNDMRNMIKKLKKGPWDAAKAKEILGELADELDEAADVLKETKAGKEAKIIAGKIDEAEGLARDAEKLERKIMKGEATEEDIREYKRMMNELSTKLDEISESLERASEFSKAANFIGVYKDLKNFDNLLPAEKGKIINKLLDMLERDRWKINMLNSEIGKLEREIKKITSTGKGKYLSTLINQGEKLKLEKRLEELKTLRNHLRRREGLTAKYLLAAHIKTSLKVSLTSPLAEQIAKQSALSVKVFEMVKSGASLKFLTHTLPGRVFHIVNKGRNFLESIFPHFSDVDEIDAWSLGIYEKIPDYWEIPLNFDGYVYLYLPNTLIMVNLTSTEVEDIANTSIDIFSNFTEICLSFKRDLLDILTDARFLELKRELLKDRGIYTIFSYDEYGNVIFNPYYKAVLLDSYRARVCGKCGCRGKGGFLDEMSALVLDSLAGAEINIEEVPVVAGCEGEKEKLGDVLEVIRDYEEKGGRIMEMLYEEIIKKTREVMKSSDKCEKFDINVGGRSYTIAKCGFVIDCSFGDTCYFAAPVVEGDVLLVPFQTVDAITVAPFFRMAGMYYSPEAKVLSGALPSENGVALCIDLQGRRSCVTVECGKPVKCIVEANPIVKAIYNSDDDVVEIRGAIVPWH